MESFKGVGHIYLCIINYTSNFVTIIKNLKSNEKIIVYIICGSTLNKLDGYGVYA